MDKQVARTHLLEKRRQINFKKRNAKSQKIMENVIKVLDGHLHIGIYLSLKDEVNTTDYLNYFLSNFESVSSSIVEDDSLVFYKINTLRELKPGYMDILEPTTEERIDKDQMDAIIVPMVGFDKHFNRIGYGKSFYDRYLSDYNGKIIGIAFDDQEYPHIPHNEDDVPVDIVVTETRILKK